MNETPSGERLHIGFFGRRNAGKSSLVNAITGQALSVVSPIKGTTTDPVRKAMELLPLGPVMIIDTPGFDDEGALGQLRVTKTRAILRETDLAVLVADAAQPLSPADNALLALFQAQGTPHIIALNKADLPHPAPANLPAPWVEVSALSGENINAFKEQLARLAPQPAPRCLVADLLAPGDIALLVTPIDAAAPKGRLILPQVQTLRDILDAGALGVVTKETELAQALAALQQPPALVVTDSQVFAQVAALVPEEVPLTSFSILFARYKGFLEAALQGVAALQTLPQGAHILIAEGCTHHRQCGDIGTAKLPRWIEAKLARSFQFSFCSGHDFPQDLSPYHLVLHCGGCMLNQQHMRSRQTAALAQPVPFTNYGITIAWLQGLLGRSLLFLKKK